MRGLLVLVYYHTKGFVRELGDDIDQALEYYLSINPNLANDFINRIEEAKLKILNTPEGSHGKYKNIKTLLIKQFPYHIYYFINQNKIIILAVLHAHSGIDKINQI